MEEELNAIEENNQITKAKKAISICQKYLEILKLHVQKHQFDGIPEEIQFFKSTKPQFLSKLIFYVRWYNIEFHKPPLDNYRIKKYYQKELRKIYRFTKENAEFYRYIRSENTIFDQQFFTRQKSNEIIVEWLEPEYFYFDNSFSTTHDYKVAIVLANDLLIEQLQSKITKLDRKNSETLVTNSVGQYSWTDKKIDLVELIYAIHTSSSINKGKVELSEIADIFGQVFDKDLSNIYRIYSEIKNRKNPTRYLDTLKEALLEKIDEELGN